MRHLGTPILETERLILRPFTAADAIPMFENWASDPEVTRFLRWDPHKDWLESAQLLAACPCYQRLWNSQQALEHYTPDTQQEALA